MTSQKQEFFFKEIVTDIRLSRRRNQKPNKNRFYSVEEDAFSSPRIKSKPQSSLFLALLFIIHCVESVRTRSFYGPYFSAFGPEKL